MNTNVQLRLILGTLVMTGYAAQVAADAVVTEPEQSVIIKQKPAPAPAPKAEAPAPAPAAPMAAPARAARSGWYVGAGLGQSTLHDYYCTGCPPITSSEDNTTGFTVFGGYQYNEYLGVEIEYTDLGERDYTGVGVADNHDVSGIGLVAVATWPASQHFDLFAKAGVFHWDQEITYNGTSGDFSGTDMTVGAGATLYLNDKRDMGLQGQWRRYDNIGTNDPTLGHKNDYDLLSLSFIYRLP